LTQLPDKNTAIVSLPFPCVGGVLGEQGLRWLSRGDISRTPARAERLHRVTEAIGAPPATSGLAGLRFWGQTGDRPSVWIAAADSVYLEPRLDHLCLHHLRRDELDPADVSALLAGLQARIGDEEGFGFAHIHGLGYMRGGSAGPRTAELSSEALDGLEPSPWLPTGPDAKDFHRLTSEIQMALHLSPVQQRREQQGLRPVNALWLWGGGVAPEPRARSLPPLFADDALLRGYWLHADAEAHAWPGRLEGCLAAAPDGFVASLPDLTAAPDAGSRDGLFTEARQLLGRGDLDRLVLLFADGLAVTLRRRHSLRFWRKTSALAGLAIGESRDR
jgi:hypothetical protein